MMKISQKRLAAFCSTILALTPECRLTINDLGWNTQSVDTANVAMVSANLPKDQFEEFTESESTEIGMDMPRWKDMLAVMNDKDSTIAIERMKDTCRINISDGKYTYTHAPLDVTTVRKRPNPPNIALPATIEIAAKEFQEAIKAMGVIADKARLTTDKAGLAIDSEGDTDKLHKVVEATGKCQVPEVSASSIFSLDYLTDIAKAMKDAGTLTVCVGIDHPVRFDFTLENIEASYLLAPRIERD